MARRIPEEELRAIEDVVRRHPDGITAREIARALAPGLPHRTLQNRLKHLADRGRLIKEGERRWAKYRPHVAGDGEITADGMRDEGLPGAPVPLAGDATSLRNYVRRPIQARKPVGYNRSFLDSYRPNETAYISARERVHLRNVGASTLERQPAGTYAKLILNRLLIDLSWNSSRLEGNTYTLLDTRRLIEFGEEAQGKERLETQMILNHKDAIEFLVDSANEIGFDRFTILNLHAILANNLLADPSATGRLRQITVGIESSVYHPLEVPQLIGECFDRMLATAAAIDDPFEQSFFVIVQLPYLQPFDGVNKRVSRLAANIPLIRDNLVPLSFTEVSEDIYTDAILGVYELNDITLLKEVYVWAYERSAARYAAVRQSLGEPDPFRLKHHSALREIVALVVRQRLNRRDALARVAAWARQHVDASERERFREIAEDELLGLHDGNFARYRIRPSEFVAWRQVWTDAAKPVSEPSRS